MPNHQPAASNSLQYPCAVIDFEATALTLTSYPIEVGLAIARGSGCAIEVWSALIQSPPQWNISAEWDPDAEKLHGISRRELQSGIPPCQAMTALNRLAVGLDVIWCDGGHYDAYWLNLLAAAAGIPPTFVLGDVAALLRANTARSAFFRQAMATSRPVHRAGADAQQICQALVSTIQGENHA